MLPTTETWRQCAVILSNAADQALHAAADIALGAIEIGDTRVNESATVNSGSDRNSDTAALLDTLLANADTDTARQFLLSHEVHIAPQAVDVVIDICGVNKRRVASLTRRRNVTEFCNCINGNSTILPQFLASRTRVVGVKGGVPTSAVETIEPCDSTNNVESLLLFPATSTQSDSVEVTVNREEAFRFFTELDRINAKLDVLLGH
ncbi:hypothetical protein LSM04_008672 [Trypanosoma melophagium]|uniref:uncharacterized protein n=1 Tax=Trypanosoma melophagium TaxID=715481 RepID=UPI003519E4B9|nr:hypothetical protein LSM04_008672 [Trypanosoma melophagium]